MTRLFYSKALIQWVLLLNICGFGIPSISSIRSVMPSSLLPNLTIGDATVEKPINQHWNPLYLMRWAAPEITHTFSLPNPTEQIRRGEVKQRLVQYEPSRADATAQSCERDLQLSRPFHNYPTSSQSSVISRQLIWHNRNHRRRHLLIIHSPSLSLVSVLLHSRFHTGFPIAMNLTSHNHVISDVNHFFLFR